MKRLIHTQHASIASASAINDEYGVAKYLPKKSLPFIEEIQMEPDFDNAKGRTVHHYTIFFDDGDRVSGTGIEDLTRKVRAWLVTKQTI